MKFSDIFKKGYGAPAPSDLIEGGLGIDVVNKKAYSKATDGSIFQLGLTPAEVDAITASITANASNLQDYIDAQALIYPLLDAASANKVLKVHATEARYELVDYSTFLVDKETNQTINGIKTFGSFPITPSSAPDADYKVANKKYVDDASAGGDIGVGQTWQDLTASRSSGVTYTNTTGKPIMVMVRAYRLGNAYVRAQLSVDGVVVGLNRNYMPYSDGNIYASAIAIVPDGSTYIASTEGTMYWSELR